LKRRVVWLRVMSKEWWEPDSPAAAANPATPDKPSHVGRGWGGGAWGSPADSPLGVASPAQPPMSQERGSSARAAFVQPEPEGGEQPPPEQLAPEPQPRDDSFNLSLAAAADVEPAAAAEEDEAAAPQQTAAADDSFDLSLEPEEVETAPQPQEQQEQEQEQEQVDEEQPQGEEQAQGDEPVVEPAAANTNATCSSCGLQFFTASGKAQCVDCRELPASAACDAGAAAGAAAGAPVAAPARPAAAEGEFLRRLQV